MRTRAERALNRTPSRHSARNRPPPRSRSGRWPRAPPYRRFQRLGAAHADRRHAEIVRGRLAIVLRPAARCRRAGTARRICLTLISASQRSSSTTIGSVEPEPLGGRDLAAGHLEAAVADQADDRQVGPRKLGRDRAGQAEAHRRPAVGDEEGLRRMRGPLAGDLVGMRADVERRARRRAAARGAPRRSRHAR